MGAELAAPSGWAAAGLLGGASLTEGGAAAAAFLTTNPVGWAILGVAAVGAVGVIGYKVYQNAHSQSQTKTKPIAGAQACTTCTPQQCKDLKDESDKFKKELKEREDDLLKDDGDLYKYRPGPNPNSNSKKTWPGHQQQFEDKQRAMAKRLKQYEDGGCGKPSDDDLDWATKPTVTKPTRAP